MKPTGGLSRIERGAYWAHHMWRLTGLILALALTVGGAGWLVYQLFMADEFSRNLVVAAVIVFAMGAHWLWTDYIPGSRQGS
jgi:hypothetical protein